MSLARSIVRAAESYALVALCIWLVCGPLRDVNSSGTLVIAALGDAVLVSCPLAHNLKQRLYWRWWKQIHAAKADIA